MHFSVSPDLSGFEAAVPLFPLLANIVVSRNALCYNGLIFRKDKGVIP